MVVSFTRGLNHGSAAHLSGNRPESFYASVECVDRHLDPLTTNLVVADASRTEKTICLAVSPSLKAYKIPGRARLFEAVQRDESGEAYDVVAGTFLVVGLGEEDFASLPGADAEIRGSSFISRKLLCARAVKCWCCLFRTKMCGRKRQKAKPPAAHER